MLYPALGQLGPGISASSLSPYASQTFCWAGVSAPILAMRDEAQPNQEIAPASK